MTDLIYSPSEWGWIVTANIDGRDYSALFAWKPSKLEARKEFERVIALFTA